MILDWTVAYFRKENAERDRRDELLDAISTIVGRMEDNTKISAFAHVIELMINAFHITGEERFVKRGEYFARIGVDLFLDDGIPLPKATNQHAHYETITGGPDFLYALLKLYEITTH